ncbi:hypothetical protein J0S82_012444, partial [Galemys pyrenaicus]
YTELAVSGCIYHENEDILGHQTANIPEKADICPRGFTVTVKSPEAPEEGAKMSSFLKETTLILNQIQQATIVKTGISEILGMVSIYLKNEQFL